MPTGPSRWIAFLHPLGALALLVFMTYVASLGLRARERGGAPLRPRHARLARWAYGLMLANVAAGVISTWALRGDLRDAAGAHFEIAMVIVALLTAGAWSSRWLPSDARARLLHPTLGLLALLLSWLQVFFGMPLLPL